MTTRIWLIKQHLQPVEKEFWGPNSLWKAEYAKPNGEKDVWEFHAAGRAEAERSVLSAIPDAVFVRGGLPSPPLKTVRGRRVSR
jgi:hypothetical protein